MHQDENKVAENQSHRRRINVVVVRHGERLDYVYRATRKNWCHQNPKEPWNPPLTERGLDMSIELGIALREKYLPELGLPPISAVYTSPFLRCRQTAAGIIQGVTSTDTTNREHIGTSPLKMRVELGLSECINDDWYRSWSLPESDGTWGFKRKEIPRIDHIRDGLDPRALQPIETLLDWKESVEDDYGILDEMVDHEYKPRSSIGGDYSYAGNPPKLETSQLQINRISNTINALRSAYHTHKEEDNEKTIVLVSHGGIVRQIYATLTGNDPKVHGIGKYCCFSIYQSNEESRSRNAHDNDNGNESWAPLVINRILWDNTMNN